MSPIITILPVTTEPLESQGDDLFWQDIFEFLYFHFEKNTAFVGFFLGYDFTQWFKSLPENRAWYLLSREGQAKRRHRRMHLPPHPVECNGWHFDLLAHKRLRIRPKLCNCDIVSCSCEKSPWMYICDTGGFFQTAFLNVIDPKKWPENFIPKGIYDKILIGKERRANAELDEEMVEYNGCENWALARVLESLNASFIELGIKLSPPKWFGPGQAAQCWMKDKAPTSLEIKNGVPEWFLDACRKSYFGGWFEIMAHGIIPGESHEYDINSAYPYKIATLPCMLHGIYDRGNGKPPFALESEEYCLVRACATSDNTNQHYIGAMLHRDKRGRICRPLKTEGWFWKDELEAAENAGCIDNVEYFEWVSYTPCKCPPPMRGVYGLYDLRRKVGKDSPLGKACKLVYNSMYGKFAQSVGEPLFGNAFYASRITSGCRKMILNAIASHHRKQKAVLMVATDAVYFTEPHHSLPQSSNLGEWEHKVKPNLTLFKPGVYWDDNAREEISRGEHPNFKARGISAKDFANSIMTIDMQFDAWFDKERIEMEEDWPSVSYTPKFAMTTALQALIQHDWELAGMVFDDKEIEQNSWPGDKRIPRAYYDRSDGFFRSMPRYLDDYHSVEYKKLFGMEDPYSQEAIEEFGITPDEFPASGFFRVLRGQE